MLLRQEDSKYVMGTVGVTESLETIMVIGNVISKKEDKLHGEEDRRQSENRQDQHK